MLRTLRIAASGFLTGLLFGVLGVVSFVAACVRGDRLEWSALNDVQLLPYWVVVAGAINGGVGAWVGRWGNRRVAPVAVVPLLLFLRPLASCIQYPSDSKLWGAELLIVVILGLFVWVAGRVGQELGVRQRLVTQPPSRP